MHLWTKHSQIFVATDSTILFSDKQCTLKIFQLTHRLSRGHSNLKEQHCRICRHKFPGTLYKLVYFLCKYEEVILPQEAHEICMQTLSPSITLKVIQCPLHCHCHCPDISFSCIHFLSSYYYLCCACLHINPANQMRTACYCETTMAYFVFHYRFLFFFNFLVSRWTDPTQ